MPTLLLVTGPPAAGKSTLAARLADDLGLPLLAKDAFKEAVADGFRVSTLDESCRAGAAAVGVLYATAAELLRRDVSCVVESAFPRGLAETDLAPLLELAEGIVVDCRAADDVCGERYRARTGRHPCHFDAHRIDIDWRAYDPLDLDVPALTVDTTDGYRPGYETVLSFASGHVVPLTA